MSKVYFISDLHLGHKRILEFAGDYRPGTTVDEHDEEIVQRWNFTITKRDKVFVLGDVCMSRDKLPLLGLLNGHKVLVRGNHDKYGAEEYMKYFEDVCGILTYKGYWLTHAPIHPCEIRGRKNIHGHVHQHSIYSGDHINVCVETCQGFPIPFSNIVDGLHKGVPMYEHQQAPKWG